eukprot:s716_g4.t1
MLTLLGCTTGGEDWIDIHRLVSETGSIPAGMLVFFIVFFTLAVYNIVMTSFIDRAVKSTRPTMAENLERKQAEDQIFAVQLYQMLFEVDWDGDGAPLPTCCVKIRGHISIDEFREAMGSENQLAAFLKFHGLDIKDCTTFFAMLSPSATSVSFLDFVQACCRMRGSASSMDVSLVSFEVKLLLQRQRQLQGELQKQFRDLASRFPPAGPPVDGNHGSVGNLDFGDLRAVRNFGPTPRGSQQSILNLSDAGTGACLGSPDLAEVDDNIGRKGADTVEGHGADPKAKDLQDFLHGITFTARAKAKAKAKAKAVAGAEAIADSSALAPLEPADTAQPTMQEAIGRLLQESALTGQAKAKAKAKSKAKAKAKAKSEAVPHTPSTEEILHMLQGFGLPTVRAPETLCSPEASRRPRRWHLAGIAHLTHLDMVEQCPALLCARARLVRSFADILRAKEAGSDLEDFAAKVRSVKERHKHQVKRLTVGMKDLKRLKMEAGESESEAVEDIDTFLDRFVLSRIGIEMLNSQYLALFTKNKGIADPNCDPCAVARKAAQVARRLATQEFEPSLLPEVQVTYHGLRDVRTIPLVPSYLMYILLELLKNSFRAVAEHHKTTKSADTPVVPIVIRVASDETQIVLDIFDRGGGIPFVQQQKIWSYMYSTRRTPPCTCRTLPPGVESDEEATPLAGFGVGLPLSRLYAECPGDAGGQMVTLMAAAALLWLWSTAWYPLERFPHSKHRRSFGLRDSGTSNSLLEKLRPCLFAEIHRCLHVAILCLAPILEGARWAFVERPWVGAGGLVCMALVATMAFKAHEFLSGPNARDWEYELLACSDPAPVPDASLKEILGKWQTKARIAATGFLWVADVFSDVCVAVTYCRNGLFVFGGLLVITFGSGVVGFLHARAGSWRSSKTKSTSASGATARALGAPSLHLASATVQPVKVAYTSFMQGEETSCCVRKCWRILLKVCRAQYCRLRPSPWRGHHEKAT